MKNIGIFAITPAQIHFYRNIICELNKKDTNTYLLVRDYGETIQLVKEFEMPHFIFSRPPDSKYGKILNLPKEVLTAYKYLREKNVDLVTGFGIYESFTSALLNVPAITFTDSEYSVNAFTYVIQFYISSLFTDKYITPTSFKQDLGKKQIRVNSFKELAYLHPKYYHPDDSIFPLLGLSKGEPYILIRFNAFDAVHDFGVTGFSLEEKIEMVRSLEKHMRVFISSEGSLPEELCKYQVRIPKNRIHDAIYFASLVITDTQTMATEGAILGTPTIRCNGFVGSADMGNFIELERRYGLLYNFSKYEEISPSSKKIIQNPNSKIECQRKREILLNEKENITDLISQILIHSVKLENTPYAI
ncbi:putative glycosyltransferase [Methanolinea mesophila]|uniref:DUF354 domain-containing protein n=1 Tax=Methanolinea mesophila TaxID=547055 RepID=UPI001AEA5A29|nr:DUF354 domain-containing protein [Methanolinea mesophila]MBP1928341.1 putative glycosyltransferase [Methanolinea mesophila]